MRGILGFLIFFAALSSAAQYGGNTLLRKFNLKESGTAWSAAGWTMLFRYGYDRFDSSGMVTVTGAVDTSTVTITDTNQLAGDTEYYWSLYGTSNTWSRTFGTGNMNVRYDPATGTPSALTLSVIIDFDQSTESGTLSNVTYYGNGVGVTNVDHGTGMAAASLLHDDHTIYRLESADHNHNLTGLQAGKIDHGTALNGLADDDHSSYVDKAGDTMTGNLRVGAGTPTIASGADDFYATGDIEADATLVVAGIAYLGDDIQLQDDKGIGISGGPEIEFDGSAVGIIKILAGNVRVGNGTPGTATDLEDLYVESDLEVDGNITGGTFKSVYKDRFHATYTNTATIINVTWTKLPFDVEESDPDNVFTLATQTITWNGTGMCHVDLYWDVNANNHAYHYAAMYKNGALDFRFDQQQIGNGNPFQAAKGSTFFYNDHATNQWQAWFYINDGANPVSTANVPARHWIRGYRLPE